MVGGGLLENQYNVTIVEPGVNKYSRTKVVFVLGWGGPFGIKFIVIRADPGVTKELCTE